MPLGLRFRRSGWALCFLGVSGLLALSSRAADNPLIGTWKQDWSKTLQEFKLPTEGTETLLGDAARAKRFVEGGVKNLGDGVRLAYSRKECTETIVASNGMVLSKESFPYKIVGAGKNYVIVDQMKNGGVSKLSLEGNSFYVEVKVGLFTYRDYFTRI